MFRRLPLLLAGAAAASLLACPARTPPLPETTSPPVHVPPGCEVSQAGEYHHADNPDFRYRAEDTGSTLSLTVRRPDVKPVQEATEGGGVSIVLQRTPEGFQGETRASVRAASGQDCPVRFPTRVTACDPRGLTLQSVASTTVAGDCAAQPGGTPPVWKEQRLLRGAPDAGSSDAGTPDGGP
jgi:hypothetical protein